MAIFDLTFDNKLVDMIVVGDSVVAAADGCDVVGAVVVGYDLMEMDHYYYYLIASY